MSVSVSDALTGLFGDEFDDQHEHEFYSDGSTYDVMLGPTGLIMKFWDQVRGLDSSEEHVINAIRYMDDPDISDEIIEDGVFVVKDTIIYDTTYGTDPSELLTLVEA